MSNLEFINKEIKVQEKIIVNKSIMMGEFQEEGGEIAVEELRKQIKAATLKLTQLKQIKSVLESWEIAKNDSVISMVLKDLANGESVNYHRLSKEQQETLKKTLEVKEDA